MPRSSNPVPQYFTAKNKILVGGLMFYFEAGTSDPKATFSDQAETIQNTHPVVLDSEGRLPNVFFTGAAKQVLEDANNVQIWERDNVGDQDTPNFNDADLQFFSTTQNMIDTFNKVVVLNDIVETLGFTTEGDGGGAQWRFTGLTGQTVSQSPVQLGDALLNDGNGNQWALVDQVYNNIATALDVADSVAKTIMNANGFNSLTTTNIKINNDPAVPSGTNPFFIRDLVDSGASSSTSVQIQREVTSATSTNPKAVRVLTKIAAGVDSLEFALSAELESDSDAVNGGASAMSAVTIKNAKGNLFAGHFQVKDTQGTPSSVGGSIVGQELNIQANDVDDGEARVGYDVIARTYQPNFALNGSGEFYVGIRIRNSQGVEGGKWVNGLIIEDGQQAIPNAITVTNSPGAGSGHSYKDSGTKARGIDLQGQYGIAAIDMKNANLTSSDVLIRLKDRGKIEFISGVNLKWEGSHSTPSLDFSGQPTALTVGATGAAADLPAKPLGYFKIQLNGTAVSIPFYTEV